MSANPWVRLYRAALHNPKIVTLSDRQHRAWHNCLLIAGDDGVLPALRDIAVHMRVTASEAEQLVCELVEAQLIDPTTSPTGERRYTMHDWNVHQYVSDHSANRVKKYRDRRKAAGLPQQQWFNAKIKSEVMAKTGGLCSYCGTSENITIDHMTPLHRGGSDNISNLQPACRACNADKRNMTHAEYLAWAGRVTLQDSFRNVNETAPSRHQTPDSEKETDNNPLPPSQSDELLKNLNVGVGLGWGKISLETKARVCRLLNITDCDEIEARFWAWQRKLPPSKRARDPEAVFYAGAEKLLSRLTSEQRDKLKAHKPEPQSRPPAKASASLVASVRGPAHAR